jgi:hypothetical protein
MSKDTTWHKIDLYEFLDIQSNISPIISFSDELFDCSHYFETFFHIGY